MIFANALYKRRWLIISVWVIVIIICAPLALMAGRHLQPGGFTSESFPSIQAWQVFQEKLGITPITLELLLSHPDIEAYDTEFIEAAERVVSGFEGLPQVNRILSYTDNPARVSSDGHTAYITVELNISLEESVEFTENILPTLQHEPLSMVSTGAPPLYRDLSIASAEDLRRGETLALPLASVALVIVFGTLVAAIIPLVVGGTGAIIGLSGIFLLSTQTEISIFALNIASLLAVGLGIDYSLFYTARFREELKKSSSVLKAVITTHRRAGPAIIFSGCTSLLGLLSLLLFEISVLRSIAIGASLAILGAMLATLTILPAVLSVMGNKVEMVKLPFLSNMGQRFWTNLATVVMKRPVLALVPVITILVVLSLPILNIRLGTVDATILPDRFESRKGFDIISEEFGFVSQAQTAIAYTFDGDPFEDENLQNLYAYGAALEQLDGVVDVISFVNIDPTFTFNDYKKLYAVPEAVADRAIANLVRTTIRDGIASFFVVSEHQSFLPESQRLASEIRALQPPQGQTYVAGGPAGAKDIVDSLYSTFPFIVAAVTILTYISLLILFRSLLLPLKAVILNVMSIIASYGALVFVFQQGNFSNILGFESAGIIEFTTPIVLFAVIFGVSMDYEIFLLSRVSEAHKRGLNNSQAITEGLATSGRVITGAGAILVIVSASFVFADVLVVQMIGFGLALSVFIDITLIRGIAAPAIMRLAGRWNWYIPKWLDSKLPNFEKL